MIELPFPSSKLAGHAKGHWRSTSGIVAQHREWARLATLAAGIAVPEQGDIKLIVTFFPPNKRGDRINYPNKMKAYFDGIADALKVNDSRFVPQYLFAEPVKNGCVTIVITDAGELLALAA